MRRARLRPLPPSRDGFVFAHPKLTDGLGITQRSKQYIYN